MKRNFGYKEMLQIAAKADLPVLLCGESGVGKEVAARELHNFGSRTGKSFVAVNCGAIQESIAESLLCGHIRGAFTGANREQIGFIRAASGGTLFLDEIGELSLEVQKKILRILQEKCVVPVGTQREIAVDFRLVCATNRDLQRMVASGEFREDLYFRISALPIHIPALRERVGEITELAKKFWRDSILDSSKNLTANEIEILKNYSWRGNIRQLKNVIERYALLCDYGVELSELLDGEFNEIFGVNEPKSPKYRTKPTSEEINSEIKKCTGNISQAARNLGISRGSLYYRRSE
ncbi:hypothetical protein AGMMS49938_00120 [Fibrobacterales bacterium]|nr:hypothetical protein AGMMS49938_00120 [Fibrobacterales bacterium]